MPPALARACSAADITVLGKRLNTRGHFLDPPLLLRGCGKRITLAQRLAFALLLATVFPSLAIGSIGSERLMQVPLACTPALVEQRLSCKSCSWPCVGKSVISQRRFISQQRFNDNGQAVARFARFLARMGVSLAHALETSALGVLLTLALSIQTQHLLSPPALSLLAKANVCPAQLDL